MLQNEKVSVYYGTKEAYEFEKQYKRIAENALYFIEGILYSGYELYSKDYKKVATLPDVGQKNYIYINTTDSSVAIWDEEQKEWIYICKPINNSAITNDDSSIASSSVVYKSLEEANKYTDDKCVEVIDTIETTIENSIFENNLALFLGTSDKYNSISAITNALDSIQTNIETDLSNIYTKNEVDNKFSTLETNIDWKEAVETYNDISTTYPTPADGWTVNVKDTDYTYRYNGTSWIAISANAIPKATSSVDGLLCKEDKAKLDGITTGAEVNQNAFTNIAVGSTTVAADSKTDTLTLAAGNNVTITPDAANDKITISSTDTNTTYSAGTGISLSGTTFSNSGVRSISTGTANGTISVNTNGTTADITVKGLGSAAYTESATYMPKTWANNTLYTIGDDVSMGDGNVGGCLVLKGLNGATGIQFNPYNGNTSQKISIDGTGTMTITGKVASTFTGSLSGNATTATKLATARTINGTSFDGSANITTSYWGTARTITIGSTGKSVNGSANVSWSLSEIGAAASSHTHSEYLTSSLYYTKITRPYTNVITITGTGGSYTTGGLKVVSYAVGNGIVDTYGEITGTADNTCNLGQYHTRWQNVYAASGIVNTSDRNLKDNIEPLSNLYKELFFKLLPVSYTFKDGTSGRTHVGFISQDVEEAMTDLGLTALDFAGFCKDAMTKEIIDEETNEITRIPLLNDDGTPVYRYSLRYEEFIAIITSVVQDLYSDVHDLKEKVKRLL